MIGKALEALGVEPQRQLMYVIPSRGIHSLPEVFELTAVRSDRRGPVRAAQGQHDVPRQGPGG
jgi:hypothetical protein